MTPRRPSPAQTTSSLPSLALALGGAAALQGCHDPVCGATRADELQAHGNSVDQAARDGRFGEAIRQFGVATGLTRHSAARVDDPTMVPAGAMPIADPTPVPTPSVAPSVTPDPNLPMVTGGATPVVSPERDPRPHGHARGHR